MQRVKAHVAKQRVNERNEESRYLEGGDVLRVAMLLHAEIKTVRNDFSVCCPRAQRSRVG